jgi:hypothetical protein
VVKQEVKISAGKSGFVGKDSLIPQAPRRIYSLKPDENKLRI